MSNVISENVVVKQRRKAGGGISQETKRKRQENSDTYFPGLTYVETNLDGITIILVRQSLKGKASAADMGQLNDCMDWAKELGLDKDKIEVVWEYGGASKKGKWRPALDKIFARARAGELRGIMVWEGSRLTRDVRVGSKIEQLLDETGIELRIYKDKNIHPRLIDMSDRIIFRFIIEKAQSEAEHLSARQKREHKHRASYGFKRGGFDPLGLKTSHIPTSVREKDAPIFVINDDIRYDYPDDYKTEAKLVREIFNKFLKGQSPKIISSWLNEIKIPTQTDSGIWSATVVRCILKNPVYAGYSTYLGKINKINNEPIMIIKNGVKQLPNEAIITQEEHEKVIQLFEKRKILNHKKTVSWKLSNIVVCDNCGNGMHGYIMKHKKLNKKINLYRCPSKAEGKICSGWNTIGADGIEEIVKDIMLGVLAKPLNLTSKNYNNDEIDQKKNEIINNLNEYKSWLSTETNKLKIESYKNSITSLENELNDCNLRSVVRKELNSLNTITKDDFIDVWNSNDRTALQIMIKAIIKEIRIKSAKDCSYGYLNNIQMKKLGWKINLSRVTVITQNDEVINLI